MSGHFGSSVHFRSSNSPTAQPPHHSAKQAKILTACVFSTFAILILLALCYVRRYWRRRDQRANRVNDAVTSAGTSSTPCSPKVLASLPIFVHSVEDDGKQKSLLECAVCLGEFKEGEKGRNLPRCGHSFHVECIDTWLDSHVTCPLCRVSVGDPEAASSESLDSVV